MSEVPCKATIRRVSPLTHAEEGKGVGKDGVLDVRNEMNHVLP